MPLALHFAGILPNQGFLERSLPETKKTNSLLEAKIQGPEFITGRAFGPEGSIQAIIFCVLGTIVVLILSRKAN
ncbi:hypothetical protein B0A79_21190 [Flavobacterium piscis]|uniref:PDGLE domain-containing protein n=2 Tax=Flavobacterium piscis TaxID=1114874 RepID=A0ABX2XC82_9FLAO|nr:hypothetical protein FLP_22050 [Flavobacterium piscis]OXE98074.1 hypothetical protein B0A79_21190 [Flavobacterium piscis]